MQSSKEAVRVMIFGLGYIGRAVVEAIQSETIFWNKKLEVVGSIDIVQQSRLWGEKHQVPAFASLKDLLAKTKPDVCIHTTSSSLAIVVEEIKELIAAGIPVVSSAEELFFPWKRNARIAEELDKLAIKNKVAVMGTGVNPGFIMDVLPAALTQSVHTVQQIRVDRTVDASTRRPPLQKKIGAGLTVEQFKAQVGQGKIGPVGIVESVDFLASYMGWNLTKTALKIEPVLATKPIKTQAVSLRKGQVCGMKQHAWGEIDRMRVIELNLVISLDANKPEDRVEIKGNPSLSLVIEGGTAGDAATVSSLIRGVPIALQARPGVVRRLERDHFL